MGGHRGLRPAFARDAARSPLCLMRGTLPGMDLRANARPRSTGAADSLATPPLLVLALAAVGASVVIGIALVTGAACGGGGNTPAAGSGPVGTITNTPALAQPTAANTATPLPTATAPASEATPATAAKPVTPVVAATTAGVPNADPAKIVPCSLLAPVDQNHRVERDCVLGPLVPVGDGYSLNADAAAAFKRLAADAASAGLNIYPVSTYRSFETQQQVYDAEVRAFGPDQKTVARPGHSEHQLGTTLDVNTIDTSFGSSPEGKWLAQNAARFGYVISYPAGKEAQSGYAYEPWHIRYVGVATAQNVASSGTTLNRVLGGG